MSMDGKQNKAILFCLFFSYVYFSLLGGRDKRGGPLLTFPSHPNADKVKYEDLRTLVTYLAAVPR